MQCPRCKNEDPNYFYQDEKQIYCRKCIQFGRVNVTDILQPKPYVCHVHHVHPQLTFTLTDEQKKASKALNTYALKGDDTLVYACCGAGKTEICFEVITTFLNAGKKVGFAIPRRQVVLEITERLKKAYPRLKIVAVCQGYTQQDDGDVIVCTMHQLYRYYQTFDLLICDEVDAFPYKNNEVLEAVAASACKGVRIYLSATPSERMLADVNANRLKLIELFVRPHRHPLIVPTCCILPSWLAFLHLCSFIHRYGGQWLVFVPTIKKAERYAKIYEKIGASKVVTSKTKDKEIIISQFKEQQLSVLFTSTILERGVTFQGVHVAVLESHHAVFDEASLIQIVGRVGRDPKQPNGYARLYANKKSHAMKRCVWALRKMNATLFDMLSSS